METLGGLVTSFPGVVIVEQKESQREQVVSSLLGAVEAAETESPPVRVWNSHRERRSPAAAVEE